MEVLIGSAFIAFPDDIVESVDFFSALASAVFADFAFALLLALLLSFLSAFAEVGIDILDILDVLDLSIPLIFSDLALDVDDSDSTFSALASAFSALLDGALEVLWGTVQH